MSAATLRFACAQDAAAIADIYGPIVRETTISFELEPPSASQITRRMASFNEAGSRYPWLVCERDGVLLGYAYAGRFRGRAAYDWSCETSIYVAADARRMGVARALYRALLELLKRQGFKMVVAGATMPNEASVTLHAAMGFVPVGVFRRVGRKFDAWHDVQFWELELGTGDEQTVQSLTEPLSLVEVRSDGIVDEMLQAFAGEVRAVSSG